MTEERHGFESPNFTQIPNDLFLKMGDMDECELKVVMYICRHTFGYHRDSFKISTRKMATAISMNTASVSKGAEAAVRRGLIERVIDGKNTTEWRAIVTYTVSEIESPTPKVIQKLNQPVSEIESQVGLNKEKEKNIKDSIFSSNSKPKLPENASIDWQIAAGVSSNEIARLGAKEQAEKAVTDLFEKEMGFNPLPWNTDKPLTRLLKFLLDKSPEQIKIFADWSKAKYSSLNPAKARQRPDLVIECWPQAFTASPEPQYETYKPDPLEGTYLVIPERK